MFHNCQKKPIFKIFFSFPSAVCTALATTTGLQCSCAALAEERAVPSHGEQVPSFPHLLSIPPGASDNTVDNIFCFPSSLHCQRHWDAHWRSQRKPTPCRAGKTCARHQAEDKLRRGHAQAQPMLCIQTQRQSIAFRCAFSISDPGLQRCRSGG